MKKTVPQSLNTTSSITTVSWGIALTLSCAALSLNGCAETQQETSKYGSYLAARHATLQRDHTASTEYWDKTLKADPENFSIQRSLMRAHLIGGDIETASETAQSIVASGSLDSTAQLVSGIDAMLEGRYLEAREILQSARTDPLDSLVSSILSAWTLTLDGSSQSGVLSLNRDLRQIQSFDLYRNYHQGLMVAFDKPDAPNSALKEAYTGAGSGSVRTAQAYSASLIARQKWDDALHVLNAAAEASNSHPVVLQAIVSTKALRQQVKAAAGNASPALSGEALKAMPGTRIVVDAKTAIAETLYSIAGITSGRRLSDRALVYLRLARAVAPQEPLLALLQAEIYQSIEKFDRAIDIYDEVAEMVGMRLYALEHKARLINNIDQTEAALALLDTGLKSAPKSIPLWVARGDILRVSERWREASEAYSNALRSRSESKSSDWMIFFTRAIAYERSKQWKLAERDLLRAIRLQPNQPDVMNYLGYSWIDKGENLKQGLALIRKAVELRPNSGSIVDSLGWAYFRMNRYTEAVRELEKAVQLRAHDSVINDHLGDAYWRVGRRIEAQFQWERSLSLEPETEQDVARIGLKLRRAKGVARGIPGPSPLPVSARLQR